MSDAPSATMRHLIDRFHQTYGPLRAPLEFRLAPRVYRLWCREAYGNAGWFAAIPVRCSETLPTPLSVCLVPRTVAASPEHP